MLSFIPSASATSPSASNASSPSASVSLDLINGIAIRILDSAGTSEINDLVFNLDASSTGTFSASDFNVEVDTSNRTGYKLYMTSDYQEPSSSGTYTTALVNLDNPDYTIPTLSSTVTKTDFSSGGEYKNHWGYSLDDTTYSPVPVHSTEQCIAGCNGEKDEPVAHDKTPVYIGMNVSLASASGTYRNNLLFSAIANPVPTNYTLSFNLNGGSAPASDPDAFNDMTASEVAAQHTFTIPTTLPEKAGNTFSYWTDSEGNHYNPGDTITVIGNEEYIGIETLTANWEAVNFWTITTMQEMTPEICNSVYTPNNGTGSNITLVDNAYDYYTTYGVSADGTRYVPQRTLYDIRGADGTGTSANPVTSGSNAKTYTIRKLADGNCWMTENLQLPLALNTPVEASYNDGAIFTYIPSNTSGHDGINTNTVTPRISSDIGNGYYYYNWYAATGEKGNSSSTSDIDGSICPKGWKLPYNYTVSTTLSWGALTNAYGVTVNGANTNTSTGYLVLQASPLSLPLAGNYSNGSYYNGGSYDLFWSSTAYGTTHAYDLNFGIPFVYPQSSYNKSTYGFNVRCVASPLAH